MPVPANTSGDHNHRNQSRFFNQSDTQHHASSSKNSSNFHDNASTSTSNSNPNRGRQPTSSGGGSGSRSPSPPGGEAEGLAENIIPEKRAGHIFRDNTTGHLPDTGINRQLIQNLVNDKSSYLGSDRFGNHWYAQTNSNGTQLWAQVRGNQIINGGLNDVPREYNPKSGLSESIRPGF